MKSIITGSVLPVLTLEMNEGEKVFVEKGSMSWMTDSFKMDTNTNGGFFKGIGRALAGEDFFMNTYTCMQPYGRISFASSFPGKIIECDLFEGESIIAQKQAFICAEMSVNMSMHFRKKLGSGFFSGEGFIMQKITGPGKAFLECDGHVEKISLAPGEVIKVNTGNVAAFDESVTMNIEMVKGIKNIIFGGEGIFITSLKGPGNVYLQSMPIAELAGRILPFMPIEKD